MSTETLQKIKERFDKADFEKLTDLLNEYRDDERSGVRKLYMQAEKKLLSRKAEIERITTMLKFEREYDHYGLICGIDEAGRGPLAGPVVAGAVILPKDCFILYLNDSKKLSEKRREELYHIITEQAIAYGIGFASPERIDEINILNATYEAMRDAVKNLNISPQILLNDAVTIPGIEIKQVPIIKGDEKSASIAAASIIAKVTRDRMMVEYDKIFPGYGFESNKGYGALNHINAIKTLGLTPIHRRSFLKTLLE